MRTILCDLFIIKVLVVPIVVKIEYKFKYYNNDLICVLLVYIIFYMVKFIYMLNHNIYTFSTYLYYVMSNNSSKENKQTMKDINHQLDDNSIVQDVFVRGDNNTE